jgi:hypothetical protein
MRRELIVVPLLALAPAFTPGTAPAQAPAASCAAERVVTAAATALETSYVLGAPAALAAAALRDSLRHDAYAGLVNPAALAARLTSDLRSLTGDGHILIEALAPDTGAARRDWIAEWKAGAPAANYGVATVRILPGNVGHLALRSFHTYADAAPTLAAALTLVRHTDALILDLRQNGGGDPDTERALTHSFLEESAAAPLRTETRQGPDPAPPVPEIPWPRYGAARPLAILLDERSFSAPEALAYGLQTAGRALVVGTASAGGAHMIESPTPLPCGMQGWIPNRRPFSPITGSNWEGIGVRPDIAVEGSDPVDTAHHTLLRSILTEAADPAARKRAERALRELDAAGRS